MPFVVKVRAMNRVALVLVVALSGCIIDAGSDDDSSPPVPFCGDAIVNQTSETCDDGNKLSGDGCSAVCVTEGGGGGGEAHITASWVLRNEVSNSTTGCPSGYDTAAVYAQPVNAAGAPSGPVIIDLFDCAANTGTTGALAAGRYQAWVEIANTNNTSVYAKSLSAFVDLTTGDKSLAVQILNDGGYFQLSWLLRGGTTNNALTCAQAGADGVEAIGTDVSNSNNSNSDIFTCDDGVGITAGYSAGTYTVSVGALNVADQSIGTAPALTNRVIAPRNAVTNLGTITIPITGQ
jgi:cysteine-rich repeat protein